MIEIEVPYHAHHDVRTGRIRSAVTTGKSVARHGDTVALVAFGNDGEKLSLGHALCTGTDAIAFMADGGMILGDEVVSEATDLMNAIARVLGFEFGSEMQEWLQHHFGPSFCGLVVEWALEK